MHRFFPSIIGPLITVYDPKIIVEVGAADGAHTRLLLSDCRRRGAILHTIDPAPQFPADTWAQQHPGVFVFHAQMSIAALPAIPQPDLVLIDGDHNYATVTKELAVLCANTSSMPLILLHDVGWPYGRRDMYHDPSRLPSEDVLPNRTCGLLADGSGFAEPGAGVNPGTCHAEIDGGANNGVLTAIEDTVKLMNPGPRFVIIPGFHGLGILAPQRLKKSHPALWDFLDLLETTAPIRTHIVALERDRVTARSDYETRVTLHEDALHLLKKERQNR